MDDRIKLAEAMALDVEALKIADSWGNPYFDPFTDANDDYAVLEWARTNPEGFGVCYKGKWMGFTTFMHMNEQEGHQYHIGDYAKTALTVLDRQNP